METRVQPTSAPRMSCVPETRSSSAISTAKGPPIVRAMTPQRTPSSSNTYILVWKHPLHYLPPGDEIASPTPIGDRLKDEISRFGLRVVEGSVWTTDAPYRETKEQLQRHAAAGVLAVEMHAASLFAFATAHQVGIGIVAQVTNAVDHQDEQFDKGTDEDTFALLRAMLRAGHRYIETTDIPR